jgi:hypothetical protein
MAGYHLIKTLHSNAVIQRTEPVQYLSLPPYTTLLYRLLVINIANWGNNIQARISTVDTFNNTYTLGTTPVFANPGRCSLSAATAMSTIRIQWLIAVDLENVTITDEIEVLG